MSGSVTLEVARGRIAQSDLAWLAGFLEMTLPEREDVAQRALRVRDTIQGMIACLETQARLVAVLQKKLDAEDGE